MNETWFKYLYFRTYGATRSTRRRACQVSSVSMAHLPLSS
jgi:hypothetical protein